jgi:hypothetical protein
LYLEYDVKGPQVTNEEVSLVYKLKNIDGTAVSTQ